MTIEEVVHVHLGSEEMEFSHVKVLAALNLVIVVVFGEWQTQIR